MNQATTKLPYLGDNEVMDMANTPLDDMSNDDVYDMCSTLQGEVSRLLREKAELVGRTKLTRRQAAIISTFTGVLCGPFGDVLTLGEELLGRPMFDLELALPTTVADLKEKSKPLFLAICADREN